MGSVTLEAQQKRTGDEVRHAPRASDRGAMSAGGTPRAPRRLGWTPVQLTLYVWLCTPPLVAFLVAPWLGLRVALAAALLLLVAAGVACWALCAGSVDTERRDVVMTGSDRIAVASTASWGLAVVAVVMSVFLGTAVNPRDAWSEDARGIREGAAMPGMMAPPVSAVLPSSRSVQVGTPATAFATMINMGPGMATGCGLSATGQMPGAFMYQATDPATNQPIGMPNAPMDLPMGGSQTFVFAFTPAVPMGPTDMAIAFGCQNTGAAAVHPGLNTLLLSASMAPVPDMVALAATLGGDGVVDVPGVDGTGAFAVATVNMGAAGAITASADTGGVALPVTMELCETAPATGQCISPVEDRVTVAAGAGTTSAVAVFIAGHGPVPFDPAAHRVFVRFTDAAGLVRGMTSVAVRTQ